MPEAIVSLASVLLIAFLTGIATLVRVFIGAPLGLGTAAVDVAIIAMPVLALPWLRGLSVPAGEVQAVAPAEETPAPEPAVLATTVPGTRTAPKGSGTWAVPGDSLIA